jgi:hypothetical protein
MNVPKMRKNSLFSYLSAYDANGTCKRDFTTRKIVLAVPTAIRLLPIRRPFI